MAISEAFVAAIQDKCIDKFEAFEDKQKKIREISITFTDGTELWINAWDLQDQGLKAFFRKTSHVRHDSDVVNINK